MEYKKRSIGYKWFSLVKSIFTVTICFVVVSFSHGCGSSTAEETTAGASTSGASVEDLQNIVDSLLLRIDELEQKVEETHAAPPEDMVQGIDYHIHVKRPLGDQLITYDDAIKACNDLGARLCHAQEIRSACVLGLLDVDEDSHIHEFTGDLVDNKGSPPGENYPDVTLVAPGGGHCYWGNSSYLGAEPEPEATFRCCRDL